MYEVAVIEVSSIEAVIDQCMDDCWLDNVNLGQSEAENRMDQI